MATAVDTLYVGCRPCTSLCWDRLRRGPLHLSCVLVSAQRPLGLSPDCNPVSQKGRRGQVGGKFRAWASGAWRTGFEPWVHYLFAINISEHPCKVGIKIVPTVVLFSSVSRSVCPALCDPMDCSMPGLPVHHQLLLQLMSIELVMLCSVVERLI